MLKYSYFDEETEILTSCGWKNITYIKENDVLYSYNIDTENCEYIYAEKIYSYNYEGCIIKVKSQSIDQCISLNHKILVSYSYDNKKWKFDEVINNSIHKTILMKKNCRPIEGNKDKTFIIPKFIRKRKNQYNDWVEVLEEKEVDIHNFMNFLGFYISDGCIVNSGEHYNIYLSKGNEKIIDKYREILSCLTNNKILKRKDPRTKCWTLIVHDRRLYEFLVPLGKATDKHIPNFVFNYDYTILESLYEGFKDGDMNKPCTCMQTVSKTLADDFQRLMLHLGYSATILKIDRSNESHYCSGHMIKSKNPIYNVSINKTKNEPIIKTSGRNAFIEEYYIGKIYQIEVYKNTALYIRRNGKVSWA